MIGEKEIIIRLVLSALAGGLIGFEREAKNRPAGLRTHVLVAVGSALIMLISKYGFDGVGDPGRMAAQVVTGVGFLGAGTIMKTGNDIQGLTTAASLWACSGIGLGIGSGYLFPSLVTTLIVLVTLLSFRLLEANLIKKGSKQLLVSAMNRPGIIGDIGTFLGKYSISIKDIRILNIYSLDDREEEMIDMQFSIKALRPMDLSIICAELYQERDIKNISYENRELCKKNFPSRRTSYKEEEE